MVNWPPISFIIDVTLISKRTNETKDAEETKGRGFSWNTGPAIKSSNLFPFYFHSASLIERSASGAGGAVVWLPLSGSITAVHRIDSIQR